MAGRQLSPEEQALWNALAGSVRPFRVVPGRAEILAPLPPATVPPPDQRLTPARPRPAPPRPPAATLDSSWEKRIRGGTLTPDLSIDLHGHSLAAAHLRLSQAIGTAVAQGWRVLLVVTGKPRKNEVRADGARRGAIRAEIGHWLGRGPHADRIASVRVAHPRHGGDGALYVILRRIK